VATKEIDVPVPWGLIKIQIFGDLKYCSKPLVGLTGYLDNSNSYKPLAYYLNKSGYHLISIDYPGHGFR
jgi:alpha-beta hydrolase superfamily lysophospholipase